MKLSIIMTTDKKKGRIMIKKMLLVLVAISIHWLSDAETLSKRQLQFLNENIRDYDRVGAFSNGRAFVEKAGEYGYIDKKGNLVIKEDISFNEYSRTVYLENKTVRMGYDKSGKSCLVKDGAIVSGMKGEPVVNLLSKTVFKKKDGSYAGVGDLEEMGYSPFPTKELNREMYRSLFCYGARDGAGVIDGYIMCRNGKYGVVDNHGNTLFPFIHTDYVFVYWNGFFITCEAEVVEEDSGFVRYPKWYDIYKDGKKIFEKISNINIVTGYDFICFYDDEGNNAFIMNTNGQEIKKVPYGKNYFKYVGGRNNWLLENKNGEPVLDTSFPIDHIRDNYYSVYKDGKSYVLDKEGHLTGVDGVPSIAFVSFSEGTLSLDDLKKNFKGSRNDELNVLYKGDEILSREDMLLNIKYVKYYHKKGKHIVYKEEKPGSNYMQRSEFEVKEDAYAMFNAEGKMILPFKFDEIGYFSEGLIHVKYKGRWYYTNEKGDGLPTDALKE